MGSPESEASDGCDRQPGPALHERTRNLTDSGFVVQDVVLACLEGGGLELRGGVSCTYMCMHR